MDPWSDALLNLPAAAVPAGHTPDFDAQSPSFLLGIALLVVSVSISTATIIIRCYTIFIKRKLLVPDILVILSWVFLIPYTVFVWSGVLDGVGKHQYDVRIRDGISILWIISHATIMYIMMACLLKIAILLQYFHLFVVDRKKTLGIIIWATISIIAVFTTIILGCLIWQCNPRVKIWNPFVPGTCHSWQNIVEASGVFNVISDFAVLLIPIFPVCKLQLSTKRKIQIIGIFAIGFLDCLASVGRTYYTWVVGRTTDQTYIVVLIGYWAWAELTFGFVVACLPTSTLFVKTLREKFGKSKRAGYKLPTEAKQQRPVYSGESKSMGSEVELGLKGGGSWTQR